MKLLQAILILTVVAMFTTAYGESVNQDEIEMINQIYKIEILYDSSYDIVHAYSDDELKKARYDDLLSLDENLVRRKLNLLKDNEKEELKLLAKVIARRHDVSPTLFISVIKAESEFNPKAKSGANSKGLCQIHPVNYKTLGIRNPFDVIENLNGGAKLLKRLLTKYNGKIKIALAAYNAGETAVRRYNNQVPPFPETRKYVKKVLTNFKIYKKG